MITEIYDALVSAGADDGKARRAAEVLADYDGRFDQLERRIDGVERRIDLLESNMNSRFTTIDAGLLRSKPSSTASSTCSTGCSA